MCCWLYRSCQSCVILSFLIGIILREKNPSFRYSVALPCLLFLVAVYFTCSFCPEHSWLELWGWQEDTVLTAIVFIQVCKYFLDAIENNKYGWFWVCPGGGDNCMYRHALPPGFVLKKDKKKEEKQDEISLEDLIEKEVKLADRYLLVVVVFITLKRHVKSLLIYNKKLFDVFRAVWARAKDA